jgi:hypothetical protein
LQKIFGRVCSYLLIIINRTVRWIEVVPLQNIEASICVWVLVFLDRSPSSGVPSANATNEETQFFSSTWDAMCQMLAIHHITKTSYDPQSTGMLERVHSQINN